MNASGADAVCALAMSGDAAGGVSGGLASEARLCDATGVTCILLLLNCEKVDLYNYIRAILTAARRQTESAASATTTLSRHHTHWERHQP